MSISKEEFNEFSKHLVILIKDFERVSAAQLENTHKSAEYLNQTISANDQRTQAMLDASGSVIQQQATQAITSVTEAQFGALEQRINDLCKTIEHTARRIDHSSTQVSKQTKVTGWTTVGGIVLACVAVIGATIWYVATKRQELTQISEANKRIEYNMGVKKALNKVDLRNCGGKACIKLDEQSARWGANGEFILVE